MTDFVRDFYIYLAIGSRGETEDLLGYYPNILNSYWYFKNERDWVREEAVEKTEKYIMDSGAFSAFTGGKCVYMDQYVDFLKEIGCDDKKFEYITLDVIGDGVRTFALLEKFFEAGMNPCPVFHAGSNLGELITLCEMGIERLSLGGLVGKDNKHFLDEAWRIIADHQKVPMRVHGLGLTNFRDMIAYPWWSVDSSSVSGCYRFGRAFTHYERHNRRFAGGMHVHDYMRTFVPEWEDQPVGRKPQEMLGNVSPMNFLLRAQSKLWFDVQEHLQELRLKASYSHIGSQSQFNFMGASAWTPVAIPDDELPLIAPPSARGGGMSIELRQEGWDFSEHIIDREKPECNLPGVIAIDYETFYSTEYSVKGMGAWQYSRDERFNAYCIGIVGEGREWVGPCANADWNKLRNKRVLVHNQSFERNLSDRLIKDRIIPEDILETITWVDTADLAAHFGYPRALDGAIGGLFGEFLDKDVRKRLMSCDCTEEEVVEYCAVDCVSSHRIYERLYRAWPKHEERISQETYRIGRGNIYVNTALAEQWLGEIADYLTETRPLIPFDPPGSDPKAAAYLDSHFGEGAPPNWRVTEPPYMLWKSTLSKEAHEWVTLREDFKKARKIYGTIEAILARTDDAGRLFYELLYFGATTGRWSGAGGLNMQNWHRKARWNIRHLLVAPPGYLLGIHDFAQIEARALLWLAGDWDQLALIEEVGDVYEAHARATMNYTDVRPMKIGDPDLRHLAKARVLALGYGCGDQNFQFMAKSLCDLDLTQAVCTATVNDYRQTNLPICELWKEREAQAKACIGGNWSNMLPSGREMHYRDIQTRRVKKVYDGKERWDNQLTATIGRRTLGIYGGLLVENETQAFSRDIMASAWLRCGNAGYHPAMTVHDELVFLYPEKTAERDRVVVDGIMSRVPAWCARLPLEVEGELTPHYKK